MEPWSPLRAFHHEFWYSTTYVGYYRPLVIASFGLNGRILGWGPGWFHLVNVLLHIANAVMVLAIARRSGVATGPASLAAVIFAVHPATSKYSDAAAELRDLVRIRPEDPDVRSPFVVSLIHAGDLAEAPAKVSDFDGYRGTPGFDQLAR
jgi:hypothetical protein